MNPGFEDVKKIPNKPYQIHYANNWSSPNIGSPDLFSSLSKKKDVRTSMNSLGSQPPYEGNNYAGIFTSVGEGKYHGEFIQGTLTSSLKKDKYYVVQFFYSLADKSSQSEVSLGACFSDKRVYLIDKFPKGYTYSIETNDTNKLKDKNNWNKVTKLYRANGTENFIIIGKIEQNTPSITTNNQEGYFAYYYIDNVSVVPFDTIIAKDSIKDTAVSIIPNKEIVLTNLYFGTGSSTIKNESYRELDNLFEQLKKIISPTDTIVISGHTDDVGKEEDNLKLSENRAKAVAEYLIKKGLQKENIKFVGYGSSKPIADNETEQGREQNRRVELFIKKEIK